MFLILTKIKVLVSVQQQFNDNRLSAFLCWKGTLGGNQSVIFCWPFFSSLFCEWLYLNCCETFLTASKFVFNQLMSIITYLGGSSGWWQTSLLQMVPFQVWSSWIFWMLMYFQDHVSGWIQHWRLMSIPGTYHFIIVFIILKCSHSLNSVLLLLCCL